MARLAHSIHLLTPSLVRAAGGLLPADRRTAVRRSLRFGCRVRRLDGRLVGDRSLDLSPRGMLVLSDDLVAAGTPLSVSFQSSEIPLWFDTSATVARVVHGRRQGDSGRALGLSFGSLPAVSRLILRGLLRKAPLLDPLRAPPPEFVVRSQNYAEAVRRAAADATDLGLCPVEMR